MFLIPPEHHVGDTDRAEAERILGPDLLSGVAARDGLFDSRDLFNLGLHSGTGRTVPELAFAFALRWMRLPTGELLAPKASRFSFALTCACPKATLARPRPDLYGGDLSGLSTTPVSLAATVRTVGSLAPLRSPALVSLVREFASLGLRWVKLPDALRRNEDLLVTHRVASCESASRYLARRCREAGLPATTRIGWVIGMLDLVHAWVEVTDEDGVTKVVDPIFALFAGILGDANPVLTDPAMSLRTNRLIPTDLPVGGRVAQHGCDSAATIKITQLQEKP